MLLSNLKVDGEKQQSRIKERGWLDNKHGSGDANSDAADTAADKPSSYSHSAATPRFLTGSFSDMFRKLHLKNSNEHLYENRKANRRIQFTNPVNFRVDHSDTALTTDDQSIVSIYSTPNRSTSSPSSSLSTPVPYSSQLLQQYQRSKSKADLKRIRNNSIAADSPYAADKRVQRRVHDWVSLLSVVYMFVLILKFCGGSFTLAFIDFHMWER